MGLNERWDPQQHDKKNRKAFRDVVGKIWFFEKSVPY